MTTLTWRDGVTVVRAAAQGTARQAGGGRATVFDFAGSGGARTWIGTVTVAPGATVSAHHHGRHEVALYVVQGRSEIRWGERLEYTAELGAGDFAYFAPFVPHHERNLDPAAPLEFLVVRSDNERIAIPLGIAPVERPESIV